MSENNNQTAQNPTAQSESSSQTIDSQPQPTFEPVQSLQEAEQEQDQQEQIEAEQQEITAEQTELEALKKELSDVIKQPILDSGYFSEKDLSTYELKELKAMAEVLKRVNAAEENKPRKRGVKRSATAQPKKPIGRWKNPKTGEWEA